MSKALNHIPNDVHDLIMRQLSGRDIMSWGLACKTNLAFLSDAIAVTKHRLLTFDDIDEKMNDLADHIVSTVLGERRMSAEMFQRIDLNELQANATSIHLSAESTARKLVMRGGDIFAIHIDSSDDVVGLIALVAQHKPRHVLVTCDEEFNTALQDEHVKLLSEVPLLALLGHRRLTDLGLAHIAKANVLWIGGCVGIRGSNLPKLVFEKHALFSIKWAKGWGHMHPFDVTCAKWLHRQARYGTVVNQG